MASGRMNGFKAVFTIFGFNPITGVWTKKVETVFFLYS